jgi:hypothetical protein
MYTSRKDCLRRKLLLFLLLTAPAAATWADYTVFSERTSRYSIVVDAKASVSEHTAAQELQTCLRQIGGAELPIVSSPRTATRNIYVGYNSHVARLTGRRRPADSDESFVCRNYGSNIVIYGGARRGTLYGVYRLLEEKLGVRWYAPDCQRVPQLKRWRFSSLNFSEKPALGYRHVCYYGVQQNAEWRAHNELNMSWDVSTDKYGGNDGYWSQHTMGRLVPESQYFDKHPEYYALIKGRRTRGAQLCLSNPDVLKLCIANLRDVMRKNPNYVIYSLSQNDNNKPCTCSKCQAIEKRYGGHSGLILWFVNQAADALKDEFPDKYIGTFAYNYSRQAPTGIRPRPNVVVRLCDIECCFLHPLYGGCERNRAFVSDMQAWGRIAPHIFIWDYVVNFHQYLPPFPNFAVLAPNIRFFQQNHAIGIMEEADYQAPASEFSELRSWVLAKLMWNPTLNTDALVREFISAYYGKAAPYIQHYFDSVQSLVRADTHPYIFCTEWDPLYTETFCTAATKLLDQARAAAEDSRIRDRVDIVRLQMLYLNTMRHKEAARTNGSWEEFKTLVRKYNARPSESADVETFIRSYEKK